MMAYSSQGALKDVLEVLLPTKKTDKKKKNGFS
jgi:hypothetical protein